MRSATWQLRPSFAHAALRTGALAVSVLLPAALLIGESVPSTAVEPEASARSLGAELIENGSFAAGTQGWTSPDRLRVKRASGSRGDVAVVRWDRKRKDERTTVRLSDSGRSVVSAAVGSTYRARAMVSSNKRKGGFARLRIREMGGGQKINHHARVSLRKGAWKRLEVTMTTTLPDASLDVRIMGTVKRKQRLRVDDVSLAAKTARAPATPAAPAPPATPVGAFPNAQNTGVPAGVVLTPSGGLTVTTDGAVIENLDIRGQLQVRAANVTVRNVRVTSSSYYSLYVTGSGARIENVEVDGQGMSGTEGSAGIGGGGSNMTVIASEIRGVENGVVPASDSVVRDSYIHSLAAPGSPHYDGVQMDGGLSNIDILHNTVDMTEHDQTAAVMVDNYFGPISDVVVSGNLLRGGGYTVYADGSFSSTDPVEVTYADNVLDKGHWGYFLSKNSQVSWVNNTDSVTGAPVRG